MPPALVAALTFVIEKYLSGFLERAGSAAYDRAFGGTGAMNPTSLGHDLLAGFSDILKNALAAQTLDDCKSLYDTANDSMEDYITLLRRHDATQSLLKSTIQRAIDKSEEASNGLKQSNVQMAGLADFFLAALLNIAARQELATLDASTAPLVMTHVSKYYSIGQPALQQAYDLVSARFGSIESFEPTYNVLGNPAYGDTTTQYTVVITTGAYYTLDGLLSVERRVGKSQAVGGRQQPNPNYNADGNNGQMPLLSPSFDPSVRLAANQLRNDAIAEAKALMDAEHASMNAPLDQLQRVVTSWHDYIGSVMSPVNFHASRNISHNLVLDNHYRNPGLL